MRAAALRALGRLGRVPDEALDSFVAAFADDVEFVRVQAAHAAVGLSEPVSVALLIQSLGDLSWWVRRASAESLLRVGVMGRAALRQAAQSHPDRYARGMSAQVLADAAQSDSPDFERLEEFV